MISVLYVSFNLLFSPRFVQIPVCSHLKYLLEFLQKSQTLQGILGIRITFVYLPAEMAL